MYKRQIPGLIEGASEGVGLGHEFLRHIERTRVIIHIVDAASTEGRDPIDDIYKINKELEAYNPEIAARPQVIAANKIDCIYTEDGEEDVYKRQTKKFLIHEWEQAKKETVTPNCRQKCSGCGAMRYGGGVCYEGKN